MLKQIYCFVRINIYCFNIWAEVSGLLKSSVLGWVGFENFHIVQPEENNSQVGNNSLSCCSSFQCGGKFLGIQQRILLSELDSFDLTWKYFNLIWTVFIFGYRSFEKARVPKMNSFWEVSGSPPSVKSPFPAGTSLNTGTVFNGCRNSGIQTILFFFCVRLLQDPLDFLVLVAFILPWELFLFFASDRIHSNTDLLHCFPDWRDYHFFLFPPFDNWARHEAARWPVPSDSA